MFRFTNPELPAIARPLPKSASANFVGLPPLPNSPVFRLRYARLLIAPTQTLIPEPASKTPLYSVQTDRSIVQTSLRKIPPYQVAPETYWFAKDKYYICSEQFPPVLRVEATLNLSPINFDTTEVSVIFPSDLVDIVDIHYRGTRLNFARAGKVLVIDVCDLCCPRSGTLAVTAIADFSVSPIYVGDIYLFNIEGRLGSVHSVEWRSRTFVRASRLEMFPGNFHWDWRNNQLKLLV